LVKPSSRCRLFFPPDFLFRSTFLPCESFAVVVDPSFARLQVIEAPQRPFQPHDTRLMLMFSFFFSLRGFPGVTPKACAQATENSPRSVPTTPLNFPKFRAIYSHTPYGFFLPVQLGPLGPFGSWPSGLGLVRACFFPSGGCPIFPPPPQSFLHSFQVLRFIPKKSAFARFNQTTLILLRFLVMGLGPFFSFSLVSFPARHHFVKWGRKHEFQEFMIYYSFLSGLLVEAIFFPPVLHLLGAHLLPFFLFSFSEKLTGSKPV